MENENPKNFDQSVRYTFTTFIFDHFSSIASSAIPEDRRELYEEDHFDERGDLKREWREFINDYLFNLASSNPRVFAMLMDSYTLYLYTEVNGHTLL